MTSNMTTEMISEITFREVSRVTQNISKETAMMSRRMNDMHKRLQDLDYDRPLFY